MTYSLGFKCKILASAASQSCEEVYFKVYIGLCQTSWVTHSCRPHNDRPKLNGFMASRTRLTLPCNKCLLLQHYMFIPYFFLLLLLSSSSIF